MQAAVSETEYAAILEALGFRVQRTYIPMCHAANPAVPEHPKTLFRLGDHDLDQHPRTKWPARGGGHL